MTLFILFLVLNVLAFSQAHHKPKQERRYCTKPGPLCETCNNMVICVENSNGSWRKNFVGSCPRSQNCVNGTCSYDPEPICDGIADLQFKCRKIGVFPDPFYCNKFVMCIDRGNRRLVPYVYKCTTGYGFNPDSSTCDVELEGGQCPEGEYPVPLCETVGQSGALDNNPSMYYTCEEYSRSKRILYPVLDQCPRGEVYSDYRCHEGTTSITTTVAHTTTTTDATTISDDTGTASITTTVADTTTTTDATTISDETGTASTIP